MLNHRLHPVMNPLHSLAHSRQLNRQANPLARRVVFLHRNRLVNPQRNRALNQRVSHLVNHQLSLLGSQLLFQAASLPFSPLVNLRPNLRVHPLGVQVASLRVNLQLDQHQCLLESRLANRLLSHRGNRL
jgi:hypothetical protein